ncbi:MAG: hypothetical protein OXC10_11370 [Rhodospirillaceae bacterium]|nr:hypothetical protein [Rhodospirillaceae bacterium]
MRRFGAVSGRLSCGIGAVAIVLLALDRVLEPAGDAIPGGLLRVAILAPLAIGGVVAGFFMLRSQTGDRTTRRLLLAGAVAPFALVPAFVAAASGVGSVAVYGIVVAALILCWAVYAGAIAFAGLRLRRAGEARATGQLLCGAGAGLMLQSIGGAGGLLFGPDRDWPDLLIQAGIAVGALFLTLLLTALAFTRRRPSA